MISEQQKYQNRKYYLAHQKEIIKANRLRYTNNKETILAKQREKYSSDPSKREKIRRYQAGKKDGIRAGERRRYRTTYRKWKLASHNRYYHANKKKCCELSRRSKLIRVFGITADKYDEMLRSQNGRCKICKRKQIGRRLAVDHCHKTGLVRSLLCSNCNSMLGQAREDVKVFRAAIAYINRFSLLCHI